MTSKNEFAGKLNRRVEEENTRRNIIKQSVAEARETARGEIQRHSSEVESLIAEAREAYEKVILPWLAEYTDALAQAYGNFPVRLSSPISGGFPESAFRALDIDGVTEVTTNEKWSHTFYLEAVRGVLEVRRQPETGIRGLAHALMIVKYRVRSRGEFEDLCGARLIHPEVIIEFARQIVSGNWPEIS